MRRKRIRTNVANVPSCSVVQQSAQTGRSDIAVSAHAVRPSAADHISRRHKQRGRRRIRMNMPTLSGQRRRGNSASVALLLTGWFTSRRHLQQAAASSPSEKIAKPFSTSVTPSPFFDTTCCMQLNACCQQPPLMSFHGTASVDSTVQLQRLGRSRLRHDGSSRTVGDAVMIQRAGRPRQIRRKEE